MCEYADILNFPRAKCTPMKGDELLRNLRFVPSATRKDGSIPGTLSENTEFGCYKVEWDVSPLPKDASLTL